MEKPGFAGDNRPQPVGYRWTTRGPAWGRRSYPQSVEDLRPRFHRPLSWADVQEPACLWTQFGTTSQSPVCGRKKVAESVEEGRNQAGNRTRDDGEETAHSPASGAPAARKGRRRAVWRSSERAGAGRRSGARLPKGRPRAGRRRAGGRAVEGGESGEGAVTASAGARGRRGTESFRGRPLPRWHGPGGTGRGPCHRARRRLPQGARKRRRAPRRRWCAPERPPRPRTAPQPFLMRLVSSVTWL